MASADVAGRRVEDDDRVLSRAPRPLRRWGRSSGSPVIGHGIPFLDLHPDEDAGAVREAIQRVLSRGWFILGPEVEAFEAEFADACGALHAVAVGNGTDAITLMLRALGIGAGDEVIVPAITAGYTALAVTSAGAVPVVADVDDDT